MTSVDPGAQRGRDRVLGEIHADASGGHDRRLASVEAGLRQPLPPAVARLEVDWNESQPLRDAEADLAQALSFPSLRTGLVDLKYLEPGGDLRPALGEGVQARPEDDVHGPPQGDAHRCAVWRRDSHILHDVLSLFRIALFAVARTRESRCQSQTQIHTPGHIALATKKIGTPFELVPSCAC
jgi:hypothetical protein